MSGVLPHEQAEVVLVEDKTVRPRRGETPTDRQPAAPGAALPHLASAADANNNMPAFRFSSKVNAPRWGD